MKGAIEAVWRKNVSVKRAAKLFHVPRTTLQRRLQSADEAGIAAKKKLGSRERVFTSDMEKDLVEHISNLEKMLFGLRGEASA